MRAKFKVLLIISGSIAAYKSLDLIRRLRERGNEVQCILTRGGAEFITPLSVASLSGEQVYTDLFSLKDESEMGHIRLSREADLIVVAPASADLIAKMANGMCDDLATTCLLATDKPVLVAPAMNHRMWDHPATQRNIAQLRADGIRIVDPEAGDLACGETGSGRMAEVETILKAIDTKHASRHFLKGLSAIVTSGPTQESIDPVRYLGNHSSGKQGHAIAEALADRGVNVTLITGPTHLPDPANMKVVHIKTAQQMLKAAEQQLPADILVCAAAVADWRAKVTHEHKMKKRAGKTPPSIQLEENPDILRTLANHKTRRPRLVIGFAAETDHVEEYAADKRKAKGCDWILANDVSNDAVFGKDENRVYLITGAKGEWWPKMSKRETADRLADRISAHFSNPVKLTKTGKKA